MTAYKLMYGNKNKIVSYVKRCQDTLIFLHMTENTNDIFPS